MKTLNYENLILVIVLPPFDLGQLIREDNTRKRMDTRANNKTKEILKR